MTRDHDHTFSEQVKFSKLRSAATYLPYPKSMFATLVANGPLTQHIEDASHAAPRTATVFA